MHQLNSAPNTAEDNSKLLSALRSERARCREFEKVAKTARAMENRLQQVEQLLQRLAADQQALRAEVRRETAPLATVVAEVNELGTAIEQVQALLRAE